MNSRKSSAGNAGWEIAVESQALVAQGFCSRLVVWIRKYQYWRDENNRLKQDRSQSTVKLHLCVIFVKYWHTAVEICKYVIVMTDGVGVKTGGLQCWTERRWKGWRDRWCWDGYTGACVCARACVCVCVYDVGGGQLHKLIAGLWWHHSGRRREGYVCVFDDNKRKGDVRSFLPFVYVDKIAGFLCLLCHSCHSSANCVGFWGLVIRGWQFLGGNKHDSDD